MAILDNYISTASLAKQLNRAPETLIRWRRQRSGPPFTRLQGRVLYDAAKVKDWLDKQTVQQEAA